MPHAQAGASMRSRNNHAASEGVIGRRARGRAPSIARKR
jgi:hypothetical protein